MNQSDHIKEAWRSLYPFESHFMPLSSGPKLHYLDVGRNATRNDSTILTVHGNPTWSFYYRSILQKFSTGQRCVAIDHIGCGLSDKPKDYNYCLETHTKNLVELIEKLDLNRIVMVVHDWGGAIGLGAAIRVLDRMAGVLVLNTAAFPPPYVPLRIAACRIPWFGSWAMLSLNAFARAAVTMAINRLPKLDELVAAGLLAPYDTPEHRIGIDRFVKDIPLTRQHKTFAVLEQLEHDLPKLGHLPIRMVWGMKDWCFRPECLDRLKKSWPNAECRKLEDVGHYVMEEAPTEVNEELKNLLQSVANSNRS